MAQADLSTFLRCTFSLVPHFVPLVLSAAPTLPHVLHWLHCCLWSCCLFLLGPCFPLCAFPLHTDVWSQVPATSEISLRNALIRFQPWIPMALLSFPSIWNMITFYLKEHTAREEGEAFWFHRPNVHIYPMLYRLKVLELDCWALNLGFAS